MRHSAAESTHASPGIFRGREVIGELRKGPSCLRIELVAPKVAMSTFRGHFDAEYARFVVASSEALYARVGRVASFHDWWGLDGYEPRARAKLTRWALATYDQRDTVDVLVRVPTPLMAMAVACASLVLDGVVAVHTDRAAFEVAMRRPAVMQHVPEAMGG